MSGICIGDKERHQQKQGSENAVVKRREVIEHLCDFFKAITRQLLQYAFVNKHCKQHDHAIGDDHHEYEFDPQDIACIAL